MLLISEIENAFLAQKENLKTKQDFVLREQASNINIQNNMVQIVSEIRRCSKSTLMKQLMKHYKKIAFF